MLHEMSHDLLDLIMTKVFYLKNFVLKTFKTILIPKWPSVYPGDLEEAGALSWQLLLLSQMRGGIKIGQVILYRATHYCEPFRDFNSFLVLSFTFFQRLRLENLTAE